MSRSASALLAFAFAFTLSAADLTPGQTAYLEGVRAYNGASYAPAVDKLRLALREDPAEALKKVPSSRYKEDYLPHYFLGLALEKLGKSDEARKELLESQRQGVVLGLPGSKRILEAALVRVSPVVVAHVEPTSPPPTPIAAAPTRPAAPTPTKAAAAPPPTATASSRAAPTPTSARPTPAPTPRGSATPAGLDPAVAEAVRVGLRYYFNGDFASAVKQLTPLTSSTAIARLFLSYAIASEQLVSKKADPDALAKARAEYKAAVQALPKGDLHDELISSKVRNALSGS